MMTAGAVTEMLKSLKVLEQAMQPFNVALSNEKRKGLRTMAEGREGYAKLVSDVAITHVESLPRNEDPDQLQASLAYYSLLSQLRIQAAKLYEMVEDTQTASGADVMAMVDRYSNYLQTARKNNTALDMALADIDTYNSRFGGSGNEQPKTDTPAA